VCARGATHARTRQRARLKARRLVLVSLAKKAGPRQHDRARGHADIREAGAGQVLKCHDHKAGAAVAVKVIRARKRFHQQGLIEVKLLNHLRSQVPPGARGPRPAPRAAGIGLG
jgi:hypothetical protein